MIYMDYNATAPVHPEVLEAILPFYREQFGNPSSIHWAGRMVKGAVEEAREEVARLVGCAPSEVIFTSCGSESDNMAIKGVAAANRSKGNHIITTSVEHPAVLNSCHYLEHEGYRITRLPVDRDGLVDPQELKSAIGDKTILVSAMFANNETGVLFPVREIGAICRERGVYFHCDAVQTVGKVPVDCRGMDIGLLSLSGHKIGAPKGIGALVVRKGIKLHPLLHGGAQERNRRAGTENVAGIVALGKACQIAKEEMSSEAARVQQLRDRLEKGVMAIFPQASLNGHRENRLPTTANISFTGLEADSLLLNLDLQGIAVSSGSACSSGTLKASPVLAAMGVDPASAKGSVRFSLGRTNTEEEVNYLLGVLPEILQRLQQK
ncbi:cysteine desulfurase NifS [Geotalea toluenoxydans]|uniref:cysteine desulfurase NifS n=1 Tax=Geotalea toluenoxydans TaxID=421624 RepID=UPI0006D0C245|nr:cysteine desulfurase NifS [Geotalea toluenoxydans]